MSNETQEKTFTQADFDALKAEHEKMIADLNDRHKEELERKVDGAIKKAQAEAEKQAKQAQMSELEKAQSELAELQTKYQESQNTIALTNQKDETRKLMSEIGVDEKCLDYVFIPKDMEATKSRVKAFKEYIDNVKKETFENNVQSITPKTGDAPANKDAFEIGFDS